MSIDHYQEHKQNTRLNIGPKEDKHYNYQLNEADTSSLFVSIYGGEKLRYCFDIDEWFYWTNTFWKRTAAGDVPQYYIQRSLDIQKDVINVKCNEDMNVLKSSLNLLEEDKSSNREEIKIIKKQIVDKTKEYKNKIKYYTSCGNLQKINGIQKLSKKLYPMKINHKDFNNHDFYFNCTNGTLDLRTGEFLEFDKKHLLTQMANVEYNPEATCPNWIEAINKYMCGNEDVIKHLQEILGILFTGDVAERMFVLFVGSGRNGKSVITNTMSRILGDDYFYKCTTNFLEKDPDKRVEELTQLLYKRFALVSETGKTHKIPSAFVKSFAGNEGKMQARKLYVGIFDFEPKAKFIVATQNEPIIDEQTDGIWDRIHRINFNYRISDEELDLHFEDKYLVQEYSGILNWLLEGVMRWYDRGKLSPPQEALDARAEYREESNILSNFYREKCSLQFPTSTDLRNNVSVVNRGDFKTTRKDIYAEYISWLNNGEGRLSDRAFCKELRDFGFCEKKTSQERYWYGIRLKRQDCIEELTEGNNVSSFSITESDFDFLNKC